MARLPAPMRLGLREEGNAKRAYEDYMARQGRKVYVQDCGICVSNVHSFLATSPDGLVIAENGERWLIEVKCIYDVKAIPRTIKAVAKDRGSKFYCKFEGDSLVLKKTHAYYSQILGQMAITGILHVDFVIFAPRTGEVYVIPVDFCQRDWDELFSKLVKFKEEHI